MDAGAGLAEGAEGEGGDAVRAAAEGLVSRDQGAVAGGVVVGEELAVELSEAGEGDTGYGALERSHSLVVGGVGVGAEADALELVEGAAVVGGGEPGWRCGVDVGDGALAVAEGDAVELGALRAVEDVVAEAVDLEFAVPPGDPASRRS